MDKSCGLRKSEWMNRTRPQSTRPRVQLTISQPTSNRKNPKTSTFNSETSFMSPTSNTLALCKSPRSTKPLDKTQHYRLANTDSQLVELMIPVPASITRIKSVRFSNVVAIDLETGRQFSSFAMSSLRSTAYEGPAYNGLSPLDQHCEETYFWNSKAPKRTVVDISENSATKNSGKAQQSCSRNIFVRGWSKLHNRLHPKNSSKKAHNSPSAAQ